MFAAPFDTPKHPPYFAATIVVALVLMVPALMIAGSVMDLSGKRPVFAFTFIGAAVGFVVELAFRRTARSSATRLLRSWGAVPAMPDDFPRLHNTIDGLCLSQGIDPPPLHIVDCPTGNAAVVGSPDPVLVFTSGALEALKVVELEGLVAHLLMRCQDEDLRHRTTAAAFEAVPGVRHASRKWEAPDHTVRFDRDAVSATRFPPGLQRSLLLLADLGTTVPAVADNSAHLWVLQPGGSPETETAVHPSVDLRLAALSEA
jgi:Zn-dependent protease with chaperone function